MQAAIDARPPPRRGAFMADARRPSAMAATGFALVSAAAATVVRSQRVQSIIVGPSLSPAAESGAAKCRCRRNRVRSRPQRRQDDKSSSRRRIPVRQRLGPRIAPPGEGVAAASGQRAPVHRRLGPFRRASSPDRDGWQEMLPRQGVEASQHHRQVQQVIGWRFPDKLWGRCLNCLSWTHRVATCRHPCRCLRCNGLGHLARAC
jgi:hypothetical protein